jgi:hypothetical protein
MDTSGWSSEAPVEIVPYDPSWPDRFDEEQKLLRRALALWLVGPRVTGAAQQSRGRGE